MSAEAARPDSKLDALVFDASLGTWSEVPVEDARFAPEDYRGRRVLLGGRLVSTSIPGLEVDIEQVWRDAELEPRA